jgi:hypothetical protein
MPVKAQTARLNGTSAPEAHYDLLFNLSELGTEAAVGGNNNGVRLSSVQPEVGGVRSNPGL